MLEAAGRRRFKLWHCVRWIRNLLLAKYQLLCQKIRGSWVSQSRSCCKIAKQDIRGKGRNQVVGKAFKKEIQNQEIAFINVKKVTHALHRWVWKRIA